jgi:uncharacterized protein YbjT (DUF2867 family)
MRVLIIGAYGLIGAACLVRLRRDGHALTATGRSITEARRRFPFARWIEADLRDLTTPDSWQHLLRGIDAVVNCAGALQDSGRDDLVRVHVTIPAALFIACEQHGIRRIVHISAAGAGRAGATAFARTKGEAESNLADRDLDWVVLRPGLVLAPGVYGGSALLRGAAAMPILTPVLSAKPIHVVAMDDVTETIAWALLPNAPGRIALDLLHPEPASLAAIVAAYRAWHGLKPQSIVVLPCRITAAAARAADALAWLGWRSPLRTTAIVHLVEGIGGDPAHWIAITGIKPQDLHELLARHPATVQDRWFARLYNLKPVAVATLSTFWIGTGIITFGPGRAGAVTILQMVGASLTVANVAVLAGAALDIILGFAVLVRRCARVALAGMLATALCQLVFSAVALPQLFADPLSSIPKIFPVMLATVLVMAILDER